MDILLELAEKMPNSKVSITGLRISVGKMTQISVSGEVKNSDVFADVLADLKRSVVFNVDPDRMKRSSKGGVETFVITATL